MHINRRVKACQPKQQPAISVDTKKKEPLGNMKNAGRTYRRKGDPVRVTTHDFPDKELGKAVPYGVYDIAQNQAGVTVGVSDDTADSGGSNSPRHRPCCDQNQTQWFHGE